MFLRSYGFSDIYGGCNVSFVFSPCDTAKRKVDNYFIILFIKLRPAHSYCVHESDNNTNETEIALLMLYLYIIYRIYLHISLLICLDR
jgi:hypothetical protein